MILQKFQNIQKLIVDIKGLKRLWPFLRTYKSFLIFSAFLIPVISLIQMSLPLIIKRTIDKGIIPAEKNEIYFGVIVGVCLIVAEYLSRATQTLLTARAVHSMIQSMRRSLIGHILKLASKFHDKSMSGALVTRATSDFDNLSESLNQGVLSSVIDLAVLIGAVLGLFLLDYRLALAAIVILPVVISIITNFSKYLKKAMLAARVKIATLNAFTQECLYGVSTVKTLTAADDAQKKIDFLAEDYRKTQMKSVILDAILFAILDGIASITIGIILWLSIKRITGGDSSLSAGLIIAFVQYVQNIFDPLKQLGNKIAMLQGAFTSLERIFGIFDQKDFIGGSEKFPLTRGEVYFKNVSFSYDPESSSRVLNNINFELDAGKSLALVGATGSGKSTIIKLLCKLYDRYEGQIVIDGKDLTSIDPQFLREQITLVPQEITLFEGSILFNITLGNPNISLEQAQMAAHIVGADQFIETLPGKYEFVIREGGQNLSQGQRQVLTFARALARDPKIIVLDEATSSVDPQAEMMIQKAIDKLLKNRTTIIIAHRLSTIRKCDQILVMKNGKIIEEGNHETLLTNQNYYYQLHHALLEENS